MTFDKSKQVPCIVFAAEPIAQRDSYAGGETTQRTL
jgi:hypothetical protein